ncbi:ABC transporter G family member 7 (ABC transporter ABCG.7) (AtABCG7) (White-brown complex homolog protein 7) (AtWBC7) [Durusdinium trenchii]|uniref:ABC transporter G family member 7 (ABC transporter ABCG.7) (AtABCG7) (White-brown complex homolog protein 7) (AtWBC7) n=1 Tax=Durusdinium trenchii TaxID=1381693 RepID=A0ABP0N4M6_9DINO
MMDLSQDGAHRLIELEEGSGFNSEDSSLIHSPAPGNGNIRVRGRRPACHSWNSDADPPELARPPEEEQGWTVGRTRFSSFGGSALELRWEALSMCSWQVPRKHHEAVQILTNVSGTARAGKLTCILGPSGSGKTTLLNVLAGRQSGGQRHRIRITGQVWISGQRVDPRLVRSRIAYVMQKDEMFATSTPTEALSFSASLRLSGPREDRKELISELLGSLGLRSCADTYIGNAVLNGLSGGQRKRTAIGVELITRPDIVCLDEPTSGLDSFAAYQVMNVLTDLAKAGCTVICTLHQPSSEIFALIDQVICLCGGHCLWAGDRDHMASHFTKVGYPCPVGFNPADFVIFLMQTEPKPKTDELIRIWTQEQIDGALHRSSESGLSTGSTDEHEHEQQQQHELCRTPKGRARRAFLASFSAVQKSFGKQLKQLAKRELRAVVRDRTTLAVRVALSVVLTFLFGLVFQGVGRTILETKDQNIFDQMWTGLSYAEVTALRKRKLEWHFNALVQVALVAMFSACQPVILTFPLERPVFLREYSSGTYSVLPYYLSKMVVEVPLVFVQSLMTLGLCYVVMSLNGNFWALLWTIVLLSVCSVSVALAISCAVRQPRETGAVGPLVFVPQMLFSGVFIPVSHMPGQVSFSQCASCWKTCLPSLLALDAILQLSSVCYQNLGRGGI